MDTPKRKLASFPADARSAVSLSRFKAVISVLIELTRLIDRMIPWATWGWVNLSKLA